jgi:hypothetical protein
MQRNRKKSTNLAQILHPTVIPPMDTDIRNFTYDTLCANLLKVARKRKTALALAGRFANHEVLAFDFSSDEMQGEIHIAAVYVAQAVENYLARKEKRPLPHSIKLKATTKLNTFGLVVGYFTTTVQNRTAKKYNLYRTEKRSAKKQFVSMDKFGAFSRGAEDKDGWSLHQELTAPGSMEQNFEYKQTLGYVITALRQKDKALNQEMAIKYAPAPVPMKNISCLARLFVALMNPRYQGNIVQIQKNLKITEYIFKRNKEVLTDLLRKEFPEACAGLLYHLNNVNQSQIANVKEKDKKKQEKRKLEVHSVFSMKNEKNKARYSYTISINEMVNGKWQPYKMVKRHELIVPLTGTKAVSYDQAKTALKTKAEGDEVKAKQLLLVAIG